MANTTSIESVIGKNPNIATHPKLEDLVVQYMAELDGGYEPDLGLLSSMFLVLIEISSSDPETASALTDLERLITERVLLFDEALEANSALAPMLEFYVELIEGGYEPPEATVEGILEALEGVSTSDPVLTGLIEDFTDAVIEPIYAEAYNTVAFGSLEFSSVNNAHIMSIDSFGVLALETIVDASAGDSYSVTFGDVNGDGNTDIFMPGDNLPGSLLYGDGAGDFVDSGFSFPGFFQTSGAIGDINGDGLGDLYIQNGRTASVVYRNDGPGFTAVFSYDNPASNAAYRTAGPGLFADLNGDGFDDLIIENHDDVALADTVLLSDGAGGMVEVVSGLPTKTGFANAKLADIDADGDQDYLVGTAAGIAVAFNDGDGTFTSAQNNLGAAFNGAIEVGDFNADGFYDVVRSDPSGGTGISLWLGDGTDAFVFDHTILPASSTIGQIRGGDFSGDGIGDLLVFTPAVLGGSPATIVTLLNDGEGDFSIADEFEPSAPLTGNDIAFI